MAVSEDLVWLLNQLRNTSRPVERLRLLARGWRTLRELDPADRLRVAQELGIDGAEALVEQIAHRGGASPAGLLTALEALRDAGPERLREVVHQLVEPEGRKQLVEEMLDQAVARDTVPLTVPASEAPTGSDDAAVMGESAEPVFLEAPADDTAEEVEPAEPAESPVPPEPQAAAAVPEEPATPPEPTAPSPTLPRPSGATDAARRPPAAPGLAELAGALAAETSLTSRLRRLRDALPRLADATVEQLLLLVEAFPEGWARRRAVQAVLEAGLPRAARDAIALAKRMEGTERLWALTALADRRGLTETDRRALLEAAESPLLARRVRARLARTTRPG